MTSPYKYNACNGEGLWYLDEIPDKFIESLVGFPAPLRIDTCVLHHSVFGDFWNKLSGMSSEEVTRKDIVTIGKEANKPVTLNEIKEAFSKIPIEHYGNGRTYYFQRFIEETPNDDYPVDFSVSWGT